MSKYKLLHFVKEALIQFMGKLTNLKKEVFEMWFDHLWAHIKARCKFIQESDLVSNDIFEDTSVINYFKELHSKFIIVPVDKASNNFAIICKKFYLEVLGVNSGRNINGNNVYEYVKISPARFFKKQVKLNEDLGHKLEEDNKYIPLLYWTSKQHKHPYKFRFIAGASHCTNKTISVEVALALKCIKNQFKNYCAVIKKHTGLNYFWSVDNSEEFINKIAHIKSADSIETFDFLLCILTCLLLVYILV